LATFPAIFQSKYLQYVRHAKKSVFAPCIKNLGEAVEKFFPMKDYLRRKKIPEERRYYFSADFSVAILGFIPMRSCPTIPLSGRYNLVNLVRCSLCLLR
jgi:hypothetical protein